MNTSKNNINQKEAVTVLVGGCFDLLHYGHVSFLEQAKKLGTYLIVALESDENVRYAKGPSRPIHTQKQRETMLAALSCVDQIIKLPPMKSDTEYNNLVIRIHPEIIAVTEGDPIKQKKELQAFQIGATLIEIPKIHTPSTSQLAKILGLE